MIRAQGLGFSFGAGVAPLFEGVDLDVPEGGLAAIVGPSGCGKTTLLRVLAGLLPASAGRITRPEPGLASDGSRQPAVSLIFQDPRLLPWLTVGGNLEFALEAVGSPPEARLGRIAPLLDRARLAGALDLRPAALSGGMAQRVNVVRGLLVEPRVLLLDEPFSSVDPLLRETLQEELQELLLARRTTAILVTHDVAEAAFLGDEVHVLRSLAPGRPAVLTPVARIDAPRPRPPSWRRDPAFLAVTARVRAALSLEPA